jgi:hypothetical protein
MLKKQAIPAKAGARITLTSSTWGLEDNQTIFYGIV